MHTRSLTSPAPCSPGRRTVMTEKADIYVIVLKKRDPERVSRHGCARSPAALPECADLPEGVSVRAIWQARPRKFLEI